MADRLLRSYR